MKITTETRLLLWAYLSVRIYIILTAAVANIT